jgi:hypothetical protein
MYMLKREHMGMEHSIFLYMYSATNRSIGIAGPQHGTRRFKCQKIIDFYVI